MIFIVIFLVGICSIIETYMTLPLALCVEERLMAIGVSLTPMSGEVPIVRGMLGTIYGPYFMMCKV